MKRKFTKYPSNYVRASISPNDKTRMFNYIRDIYREDKYDYTVQEIADEYDLSNEEAAAYVDEWLKSVVTEYSEDLEPEIFEYLDDCGGYSDYDQKVDDVAESWNITKDLAESYVWNWSTQVDYDRYEDDE